jgi:hypothetical protein
MPTPDIVTADGKNKEGPKKLQEVSKILPGPRVAKIVESRKKRSLKILVIPRLRGGGALPSEGRGGHCGQYIATFCH